MEQSTACAAWVGTASSATTPAMVIDAHVHLYPPEATPDPAHWAVKAGESHWATLCLRRRKDGRPVQTFPTVDELLCEMDRAGVGRAVLLGWYWENPATCAWQNRFYGACVKAYPDRLTAFATLHPGAGREATLDGVRRAHSEGLVGLGELSPHAQGYGVGDPVFREVLALAGELKMPVNFHVTDPSARSYPGRIETPFADFVALARAFPAVTFILAHWGGLLPLSDPPTRELANIFYDTAASPLLYDAGIWRQFLEAVPAERVLFGSDYPLNLYPRMEATPDMRRLIAEAKAGGANAAVFAANAARLLNLRLV